MALAYINYKLLRNVLLSIPFRILLTVLLAFLITDHMPLVAKRGAYTISLVIKDILMFFMPMIIFGSMFSALVKISKGTILFVSLLLTCIIISNFFSVTLSGIFSYLVLLDEHTMSYYHTALENKESLLPLYNLGLPRLISNNMALVASVILAVIYQVTHKQIIYRTANIINLIANKFLQLFFLPLLPFFIFGFFVKIINDQLLTQIISYDTRTVLLMVILLFCYLIVLYILATKLSRSKPFFIARNILPPAITAFSTMSSAAALPFSIKAAKINTNDEKIANSVIPATANIHMIGDGICIPIIAMIMLLLFNQPLPSLNDYLVFALFFVITKFSGAGVPGGSILVMVPVLEKYLGFTPEMSGIITIFYMLVDPITTLGNVLGNNIFVILFSKLYNKAYRLYYKVSKDKQNEEVYLAP